MLGTFWSLTSSCNSTCCGDEDMTLNLITDQWIPVARLDGERTMIAPWQISEKTDNPIIDIRAPRPDFRGALYQFLIGLLQTACPPNNDDVWHEIYEDGFDVSELHRNFGALSEAFDLFSESGKPAFMQDLLLEEGNEEGVSALLIEAPGANTIEKNVDHFVKRGLAKQVCHSCAASALFTLQINAPSGGAGHRVSLRGGGPLTSLVMPSEKEAPLWKKLWLNVLPKHKISKNVYAMNDAFPWMQPTVVSDKTGGPVRPGEVNNIQMYWAMPRRIRLQKSELFGSCDICGAQERHLITRYVNKNYGTNYEGGWVHPLTPYKRDIKREKEPLSIKGQKGGLSYRNWLGLVMQNEDGTEAATVTNAFFQKDISKHAALWCFGYDMDNMKARCWYEHQFPLINVEEALKESVQFWATDLMNAAQDVVSLLREHVKAANYKDPKAVKGDFSYIDQSFWRSTESKFYELVNEMCTLPAATVRPENIYEQWHRELRQKMVELFDHWALSAPPEQLELKRVVKSKAAMTAKFAKSKAIQKIKSTKRDS